MNGPNSSWFEHRASAVLPLAIVLILLIVYVRAQQLFVECKRGDMGCRRSSIGPIVQVDHSLVFVDSSIAATPAEIAAALGPEIPNATEAVTRERSRRHTVVSDSIRRKKLDVVARRYSGRFIWAFFLSVGVLASLGGIVAAVLLLTRADNEKHRYSWARPLVVGVAAVLTGAWAARNPDIHMNLMGDVLRNSIGRDEQFGLEKISGVMNAVNSFDLSVSVALILACSIMLLPAHPIDVGSSPSERLAAELRPVTHRMKMLRVFLYVATVMLFVGVLRMQSVVDWVMTFIAPADATILNPTVKTLTWIIGGFYSLVLAAIYLPAAFVLRARIRGVIDRAAKVSPEERAKAAEESGLGRPATEMIPRVAALLGPLLAGPIGTLFASLGSHS